ncbi:MAG: gamma-glutamylcyclotransferase [Bryobacterales bacterium]|nr:gamma-glutamylcyclotransferase [Bryobacterales bacterium]
MDSLTRLASYGTLAPGRENHHQLDGLAGTWQPGTVRGRLRNTGWGAAYGYPVLVLDPEGEVIPVQVFESADLPVHWARLDEFEGEEYRRVVTEIVTADGPRLAQIYVSAE